jgi:putative transposase
MNVDTLFFDLTPEEIKDILEKYALLEPLLDSYLSDSEKRKLKEEACFKLEISERTLRRYLSKLRKKGIKGLSIKKRRDRGRLRVFDESILDKAKMLLKENPYRSIPMLMNLLEADQKLSDKVKNISCHTLYYHLKQSGYDFAKKRRESEKIYHKFEADYPNQLWQGDSRDGIYLPDPEDPSKWKKTYLFGWVDDYSRKVMYAKYYFSLKLPSMEDSFKYGALRWGLPEKLYCDNGKVYRSKYFTFMLSDLSIKKIHHPAYSAWCKGKIENIMKSFKRFQGEAQSCAFKTLDELNSALFAWMEVEYNNKIHSTTGETPNNRYQNGILNHPPKRVADIDEFNKLFLFREIRKVNKYGKVQLESNFYPVHGIKPNQKVEVRFDPFDLTEVLIYYNNQFYTKTKASILKTKEIIKEIPEEKRDREVSINAINYFKLLREKHNEQILKNADDIKFSDLNKEDE